MIDETPEPLMLACLGQALAADDKQAKEIFSLWLQHNEEPLHVDQACRILLSETAGR
jgi:hypothetical protein